MFNNNIFILITVLNLEGGYMPWQVMSSVPCVLVSRMVNHKFLIQLETVNSRVFQS